MALHYNTHNISEKIAVALSGGVDSSVAAAMLVNRGHHCIGVILKFIININGDQLQLTGEDQIHDAMKVADTLGIPFHVVEVKDIFEKEIIEPFCYNYFSGKTPSPCIRCNRIIKFPYLINFAQAHSCSLLATGHYARLEKNESGRFYIKQAKDPVKDQSYFLCMLKQNQLAHLSFPLGLYSKDEIRNYAHSLSLPVADKPDSQEICFIHDNEYSNFIEKITGKKAEKGPILDETGKVIGTHNGIHRYTIGQRRGLGIAAPRPLYVVSIDPESNSITAGYKESLFRNGLVMSDINYMKQIKCDFTEAMVKMRSTQQPVVANVENENNNIVLKFKIPQAGISPGQAAVCYDSDGDLMAAGIIESSF